MTYSVNTNIGALVALQNLTASQKELQQTQNRVNTGLKVASAKDDSSTYVVAQKLRGDVDGYGVVTRSITNAKSVVDTALAAAEVISQNLSDLKLKALEAKDLSRSTQDRENIQKDVQQYWDQIKTAIQSAEFNGVNLFKGDSVTAMTSIKTVFDAYTAGDRSPTNALADGSIQIDANYNYTVLPVTIPASTTSGTTVTPGVPTHSGTGTTAAATPAPVIKMLDAFLTTGTTAWSPTAVFVSTTNVRSVRDDNLAAEAAPVAFTTPKGQNAAIAFDYFDQATKAFSNVVSRLGAAARRMDLQLTFTSKLTDSLKAGVGNLVDADLATESTNLQALQVKQQLGIQALSIANQQPQVLQQLFRS
ncbi:flagellin [Sphingomonas sp. BK069]|uniref:flagellin n=1 Tax=Sphingomonas sp. BK069 TaxID=2586979 RepID=UPI0016192D0F|nr:flagellin [Sphingomonas sp. BK069]MBB3345785.1 flagellin [Sphingomonas sp. BK069]